MSYVALISSRYIELCCVEAWACNFCDYDVFADRQLLYLKTDDVLTFNYISVCVISSISF